MTIKTLAEVCQFSNGLWKGKKPPFVNVGVIRTTNFTKEGMLDDSNIAHLDVEVKQFEKRRLQCGDIILEKSGGGPKQPVGRVALFDKLDGYFSFSNFTSALRVLHPHELDFRFLHKFLYWIYLSGITEGMQSHSTGIRNLDINAYKHIKISLPSLCQQQKIIRFLHEAFEDIAIAKTNTEKNLHNAQALFESYLQSIFTQQTETWVKTTLKHVLSTQPHSGWSPPAANHSASGTPVLTLSSVTGFQFDIDKIKFTSAKTNPDRRYWVKNGDFLMTRSNTSELVGHVAIASGVTKPMIYPDIILRMTTAPDRILTEFLYYQMRTPSLRLEIMNRAQGTNPTMKKITKKAIQSLPIVVPPLSKQKEIVTKLEVLSTETNHLKSIYQRKLSLLEEVKKSILDQALTGSLVF